MRLGKCFLSSILFLQLLVGCVSANDTPARLVATVTVKSIAESPTQAPPAATAPVNRLSTPAASVTINTLANCPVTRPSDLPYTSTNSRYARATPDPAYFLFGTDSLWTELPVDGVWRALPLNPDGYTQKVFWWSKAYSSPSAVSGTARHMLAPAPPVHFSTTGSIGDAMVIVQDFPAAGCWEITGIYLSTRLSFVVWIDG
jgi:hypothetical protein